MSLINRLHHADMFELMTDMQAGSVDMIFADLPYNTTAAEFDKDIINLKVMWAEFARLCKPGAAICLTAAMPFAARLVMSNLEWYKFEMVWHKSNVTQFLNAKVRPLAIHETVQIFVAGGVGLRTYNPIMREGFEPYRRKRSGHTADVYKALKNTQTWNTDGSRYPQTVVKIANPNHKKAFHPTEKPVALPAYFIRTFSNPGEVVFDPCAGSGSTLIAARETGRQYIGSEIDTDYYQQATERLNKPALVDMFDAYGVNANGAELDQLTMFGDDS